MSHRMKQRGTLVALDQNRTVIVSGKEVTVNGPVRQVPTVAPDGELPILPVVIKIAPLLEGQPSFGDMDMGFMEPEQEGASQ